MMKLILLLTLLTTAHQYPSNYLSYSSRVSYTHSAAMDVEGKYWLFWKQINDSVQFEINVRTLGWVSMGISPNGAMTHSDLIVGWVTGQGKVELKDFHALSNGYPILDDLQDVDVLYGYKNNTNTVIGFQRKMDTCDEHDRILSENTLKILWAYNDNLPIQNVLSKHEFKSRGSKSIFLFDQPKLEFNRPSDLRIINFTADNILLPNDRQTYYMCMTWKLPRIGKWQIIGAGPVIESGNEGVVHHMVLTTCNNMDLSNHLGKYEPCFDKSEKVLSQMMGCVSEIIGGWAVGGSVHFLPEDLGIPLHLDGRDVYVMLQIHYDNPELVSNIRDNSGMRIYLSQQYRKTELGMGVMGVRSQGIKMIVPPRQSEFTIYSYCPATCTENLNGDGMTIYSVFPHSHLAGRKMRLRHFRKEIELEPILTDESYDFNYQENRILPKRTKILPGDELVVECVYETLDRNETTIGAFGSLDEMCTIGYTYYPRNNGVYLCLSSLPVYDMLKPFNIKTDANEIIISDQGLGQHLDHYLKSLHWTTGQINETRYLQKDGLHTVDCVWRSPKNGSTQSSSNYARVNNEKQLKAKIFQPKRSNCSQSSVTVQNEHDSNYFV